MMNHYNSSSLIIKYLDKIAVEINSLNERIHQFDSDNPIICFRGEAMDYKSTKLMPSLFRENNSNLLDKDLLDLLDDYEIPDYSNKTYLSKSIAGQHFIAISRLLDITFSVLPALYFATSSTTCNCGCSLCDCHSGCNCECKRCDNDGYIYIFAFPETFSPNSIYLNEYYNRIIDDKLIPYPRDFKIISHSYNNERIKLQSGGFILFPGKTFNSIPEEYYSKVKISRKDKEILRNELLIYFNLTEAKIYPEREKRKEIIHEKLTKYVNFKNDNNGLISNELEYYLRRIRLEVLMKKNNNHSLLEIKRFLRKQRETLEKYVLKNTKGEYELQSSLLERIKTKFIILEKEVQ